MVALQQRRRRGVHVRRGGGARRGCYIAPFTFLHQAIVLRHGPFWHNHNVIIITVAAAAFAATALCVEMGFTRTFPIRNQDATVKLKSELISIKF